MDEQGRRLLLAVAVAFGLMMAWSWIFPPEPPPKKTPAETQAEDGTAPAGDRPPASAENPGAGAVPIAEVPDGTEPGETAPIAEVPDAAPRGEEVVVSFDFDGFEADFSSYGGTLKSWKLKGDKFADRKKGGQENLVRTSDPEQLPFAVSFPNSTYGIPSGVEWRAEKTSDTEIAFRWESSELRVEKYFKLIPEDYLIDVTVDVTLKAQTDAKQALAISLFSAQHPDEIADGGWGTLPREWKAACLVDGEVKSTSAKSLLKKPEERTGDVRWVGFVHSYFLAAVSPKPRDEERVSCNAYSVKETAGGMRVDLVYPFITLRSGDPTYSRSMTAYFGPKYLQKLEGFSHSLGYPTGFEQAVDLGWFGFIAGPLLWLLTWLQSFAGNWGISIILLTVLVKLATVYWSHKSMLSMKAMARLQPQVKRIQERHKDDKQKSYAEMQELYKVNGVRPLVGCLPMFLQMPIWFALYRSLSVAAELYQAPFIPGWIDDMTAPDPYYVMPVVLVVLMFIQTRLTPTTATGPQQKMMMYGMPIMFGAMSFVFPAGLTLYIITNTILTAIHNLFVHRADHAKHGPMPTAEELEAEEKAKAEKEAAASGSGTKGSRAGKGAGKSKKKSKKSKGKRSGQ